MGEIERERGRGQDYTEGWRDWLMSLLSNMTVNRNQARDYLIMLLVHLLERERERAAGLSLCSFSPVNLASD